MYYPYSIDDLNVYLEGLRGKMELEGLRDVYYHEEIITYSSERRKVVLLTITSQRNIESFHEHEPAFNEEIFHNPKDRPFK